MAKHGKKWLKLAKRWLKLGVIFWAQISICVKKNWHFATLPILLLFSNKMK